MRVAAAGMSGAAAAVAQTRRMTEDEALAEISALLAGLPADRRQRALDEAASMYVGSTEPGADRWHPVALALLQRAGADVAQARELRAARRGGGLSGLGEQAARLPGGDR